MKTTPPEAVIKRKETGSFWAGFFLFYISFLMSLRLSDIHAIALPVEVAENCAENIDGIQNGK